jgi:hypothetical protein
VDKRFAKYKSKDETVDEMISQHAAAVEVAKETHRDDCHAVMFGDLGVCTCDGVKDYEGLPLSVPPSALGQKGGKVTSAANRQAAKRRAKRTARNRKSRR